MGMFDKPKTVAPAPKASLKKQKAEVEISGLEQLAMIKALMETLESVSKTIEGQVKGVAMDRFVQEIKETGKRPENFTAVEGGAFASIQLRRRSSAYGLSPDAVNVLREAGVEPHKEVTKPELFAINPAYAANAELLGKVEAALTGVVPDDFIMVQQEECKYTATDDTLAAVISNRCDANVLSMVTTLACGTKLKTTNLSAILDMVADLVGVDATFGAASQQAAERKSLRVVK